MNNLKLSAALLAFWIFITLAAVLTVKCSTERAVTMSNQPLEYYFSEGIDSIQFTILGRKGEDEVVDLGIDTEKYPVNADPTSVNAFRARFPKEVQGMIATYCNYKYKEGRQVLVIGVPVFVTLNTLMLKEEAYFKVRVIDGQKIFVELKQ